MLKIWKVKVKVTSSPSDLCVAILTHLVLIHTKVHVVCPLAVGHTDTGHRNMPVPLFLFGLQWPQDNKQTYMCNHPGEGWKKNLQKCHQTVVLLHYQRKGSRTGRGRRKRSWRERHVSNSSSSGPHRGFGSSSKFFNNVLIFLASFLVLGNWM